MPIERITADDLRDMEHQEGLVLQGCGGEARDIWARKRALTI